MESRVRLFAATLCRLVLVALIALAGAAPGGLGEAMAAADRMDVSDSHAHASSPTVSAHEAGETHAGSHGTAHSHAATSKTSPGKAPQDSHHHEGSAVDCCLSFCFPGLASDFVDGFDHLSAAQPESDHEVRLEPQPPHLTDRPPRA